MAARNDSELEALESTQLSSDTVITSGAYCALADRQSR
jgi:hypothetical protein